MRRNHVRCEHCGADALVLAEEGELFTRNSQAEVRTLLVIQCPRCGLREQPKEDKQSNSNSRDVEK